MTQWLYNRRDPFSWGFALALGLSMLWLTYSWPTPAQKVIEQEWLAQIDTENAPAPEVKPVLPIPPKTIVPPIQTKVPFLPQSNVAMTPAPEAMPQPPAANHLAPATVATTPVTPAPTATTPPADTSKAVRAMKSANYEAMLLNHLERIKRYPSSREARLSKPQGVVRLWLVISRQGELMEAGLLTSSGSNLLDNEALRTVRSTRFPSFPEEAFESALQHRFSVNLKYEIEG